MVVRIRSNACVGCRARRKKCDEKQPSCSLCVRRGIDCVYRNSLNIILVDPSSRRSSPASSRRQASSETPSSSSTGYEDIFDLPQTCIATAHRARCQGDFLDNCLPSSYRSTIKLPTDFSHSASTSWIYTAYEQATTDDLLAYAFSALSLAYGERRLVSDESSSNGRILYGKAMQALAMRLSTKHKLLNDSTLATVLLLIAYEVQTAHGGGAPGWVYHIRGVSTLINLRGNRNHDTEFAEQLFVGSRLFNFIDLLSKRKEADSPAFKMRNGRSNRWYSFAQLFDISQTLPAIMMRVDQIMSTLDELTDDELTSRILTVRYLFQELELRLDSWQTILEQEKAAQGYPSLTSEEQSMLYLSLPLDDPARIYPTFLCFPTLDIAQQLALKWCCSLLGLLMCMKTEKAIDQCRPLTASLYASEDERDASYAKAFTAATNITQSLEYFVHPDLGLLGTDFLGFLLTVSYAHWNAWQSKERLWYNVIFARLREINPGFTSIIESMAKKGGGIAGFQSFLQSS